MRLINKAMAYNFSYLALEYYKKLDLNEEEVMILLIIDHLNDSGNMFVTTEMISEYSTYSTRQIDNIMNDLFKRKLIDIGVNDKKVPFVSAEPFKKQVYFEFNKEVLGEDLTSNDKEMEEFKTTLFQKVQLYLNRDLSPFEIGKVDEWIQSGTSKEIILAAIEEAKRTNQKNLSAIDRLIIKRIREEDNYGNSK